MLLPKDTESLYILNKAIEEQHKEQSDNYTLTHVIIPIIVLMMVLTVALFNFGIIEKPAELILLSTSIIFLSIAFGYWLLKIASTKYTSKYKVKQDH